MNFSFDIFGKPIGDGRMRVQAGGEINTHEITKKKLSRRRNEGPGRRRDKH